MKTRLTSHFILHPSYFILSHPTRRVRAAVIVSLVSPTTADTPTRASSVVIERGE